MADTPAQAVAPSQPSVAPHRKKVHIAIPVINQIPVQFSTSLYQMISSSQSAHCMINFNQQDSLISRSRNCLFSDWLFRGDEEYFMFLDSDLQIVNCMPNNNLVDMLLEDLTQPGIDFAGGLYSVKAPGANRSSSVDMEFKGVPAYNTGMQEMLWLSTGCWMMRRKVGEALAQAYPELVYDGDAGHAGKKMIALFQPYIMVIKPGELPGATKEIRKYLSEDWAFCDRWRKIGGRIWNDSRIILRHFGSYPYDLYTPGPKPEKPANDAKPEPTQAPATSAGNGECAK